MPWSLSTMEKEMTYSFAFMEQYMLGMGRPFTSNFKSHLSPLIMRITCLLKKTSKYYFLWKYEVKFLLAYGFRTKTLEINNTLPGLSKESSMPCKFPQWPEPQHPFLHIQLFPSFPFQALYLNFFFYVCGSHFSSYSMTFINMVLEIT